MMAHQSMGLKYVKIKAFYSEKYSSINKASFFLTYNALLADVGSKSVAATVLKFFVVVVES